MTLFWVATIVLAAFSVLMVVWPMLNKKANDDEALRDELNKAFYKDRLSELKEEADEGLVDDQEDLIDDLKQSLLDDIPADAKQEKSASISPAMIFVPSVVVTIVLSYALYYKFGAYDDITHWHEVSAELPALSKKLMDPNGVELTDEEMQDLTLALRTRLHYQKDDSTGWLLLGRIALANRDVETAIGAMKKAYRLESDDDDIKLGYAQALMMSQDEVDQNRARILLSELVNQDYVDLRVFSLLAFDAFERKDFAAAIRYWGVMQQMIGPQDSRYDMLSRSIQSAREQMGEGVASPATVTVTVELGEGVTPPENAFLIVSVHSADGAPMPVAAARYPVGSFPRSVLLDDGNSMMQGRKLSDLKEFMVRARIDSDGDVASKSGDWYGNSDVAEIGSAVEVVIDKQY
ncbi:c-type cytochrome biogenesis protein CcmI [Vibrio mexicanus]|uniref:c-type cytochrome biogenesis protein CcmI n=1 Tax=Vibrio mexicanus TaxID=1004326 RepID=UPI00063BFB02|nr:c-type cytochrome biogenesis protein CcmI [Vibrio mexicanus]